MLVATAQWERPDTELGEAVRLTRDVPSLHVRAAAWLAEPRLAQGRLEQAEALAAGLGLEVEYDHAHAGGS